MKPILALITSILLVSFASAPTLAVDSKQELTIELSRETPKPLPQVAVGAKSSILVDAANGQILYEKAAHARRPMASTTKMMTAMLVLQNCKDLNQKITASKNAAATTNSSLHLKVGEKLTVRNLLYGMLIRSANDSCVAAGEHVCGSCGKFVKMMNDKAKAIGAVDTHFMNPHGLNDPNHYSTAYDLSLIARQAIQYPLFNEIVRTQKTTIERSMNKQDVALFNHSKFLKRYPGADGIKSGYTKQAGRCYVGGATRGGWRLISVVLASPNVEQDTDALMNYGFANFKPVPLASKEQKVGTARVKGGAAQTVEVSAENDLHAIVRAGDEGKVTSKVEAAEVQAPVRRGQRVGTMYAYVDGREVASTPVKADADVGVSLAVLLMPWLRNSFILLVGVMVSRYGAAAAKNAGGRRSRLAQEMRRDYRRR